MYSNNIGFTQSLELYFRDQLHQHVTTITPRPQEDTLWYTGNLLARYGRSENLYSYSEGKMEIRPLALLYRDALESGDDRERCLLLRQLGDVALFIGALFPEIYRRKGINQDYFVGMGCAAYGYLARHARGCRHIYSELSQLFSHLLELIARACSKQDLTDIENPILDCPDSAANTLFSVHQGKFGAVLKPH
ncbi:hypothetical protein [Teredinibacter turnerae]|uniref:hypothetical protein n=1 Tax=Teredinibacter turnerae TaxID=2426 RepID=UPI0003788263|nr:hypothetical protein [Teredinibacter turnerae]